MKNEEQRMSTLKRLEMLDTPAEERFDRITRTAARLFEMPMAAIGLVDESRVWFKSRYGFDDLEVPRDQSHCARVLEEGALVESDDTKLPKAKFYAGVALLMPDGTRAGSLSVMDRKPRGFSKHDFEGLGDLMAWVVSELRSIREAKKSEALTTQRAFLRDKATIDALTQMHNRPTIMQLLETELTRSMREQRPLGVVVADLDHFKKVNDTFGHQAGDAVLREASRRMKASVRPTDAVGRYGGEEFVIVLPGANVESAARTAERIRAQVGASPVMHGKTAIPVTMSLGVTASAFPERVKVEQLIKAADEALYRAKKNGRNRVEVTT